MDGDTGPAPNGRKNMLDAEGIGFAVVRIGTKNVHGRIACDQCGKAGKCVFDGVANKWSPGIEAAGGRPQQARDTMLRPMLRRLLALSAL